MIIMDFPNNFCQICLSGRTKDIVNTRGTLGARASESQRMKNGGKKMRRIMEEERGETRLWTHRSTTSFSLTLEAFWNHMFEGNERLGITFRLQTKIYR